MSRSDREMLELAAKAAELKSPTYVRDGILLGWGIPEGISVESGPTSQRLWNPLTDDGDALRLAVKLRLVLLLELPRIGIGPKIDGPEVYVEDGEDENAATRRAITRAAAEIGALK